MQIGENIVRPLAVSLLLHMVLLWPAAPDIRLEEQRPPMTAVLRPPPSPAPASDTAPPAAAPRPSRAPAPAPRLLTSAAPSTTQAMLRSDDSPRPPAVPAASEPAAPPVPAALAAPTATSPSAASVPAALGSGSAKPASAPAAAGEMAEGLRQYRLTLASQARRFKRYPAPALEAGIGGTVEIDVSVAEGRMPNVALARSSGDDSLDAAALDMMRKAAPRAAVPEALRGRAFAVGLPITFDPRDD